MSRPQTNECDNGKRRSSRRWKEEDDEEKEEDHQGWSFIVSMAVVGVASILIPAFYFWQTMGATTMKIVHSNKMAFGVLLLMILLSLIMGFILSILAIMNSIELITSCESKKVTETVDDYGGEEGQHLDLQVD